MRLAADDDDKDDPTEDQQENPRWLGNCLHRGRRSGIGPLFVASIRQGANEIPSAESSITRPISIRPAGIFTQAEDYHQKYNMKVHALMKAEFERMYPDGFDASTAAARINGFLAGFGSRTQIQEELGLYGLSPKAVSLFIEETKDLPGTCSCY